VPGRVATRRQFERLAKPSHRGRSGPVRVGFTEPLEPSEAFAVAYAVGRSVGGAVVRNRIRRRLRVAMDQLRQRLQPGLYLIKCELPAKELSYDELRHHLESALRAARVLD
jgi:ribonuclease P protein component